MGEHFKKIAGNPTHAGVFILPETGKIEYIVIDHIEKRSKENVGGKAMDCYVAVFKKNPYTDLGMVLNVTNADTVCKLAGKTPWQLLDVKNLPVSLGFAPTQRGDGLRVSKIPPKAPTVTKVKPELTKDKIEKAVEFLLSEAGSMDGLKKSFSVSSEIEKILMDRCEDLTKKDAKPAQEETKMTQENTKNG